MMSTQEGSFSELLLHTHRHTHTHSLSLSHTHTHTHTHRGAPTILSDGVLESLSREWVVKCHHWYIIFSKAWRLEVSSLWNGVIIGFTFGSVSSKRNKKDTRETKEIPKSAPCYLKNTWKKHKHHGTVPANCARKLCPQTAQTVCAGVPPRARFEFYYLFRIFWKRHSQN